MLVVAIIISVLLLIALLRVGIIVQYNTQGVALWLKIGFLKISLNTDGTKKKPKEKKNFDNLKPGSLKEFMDILKAIKEALNRLRRKLLIKQLTVHITFAGDDPSKTALQYGSANAILGIIVPILERSFRIKRRDLRAFADFDNTESKIYAKLNISIAIWEAIYTASALLAIFKVHNTQNMQSDIKQSSIRKEVQNNG